MPEDYPQNKKDPLHRLRAEGLGPPQDGVYPLEHYDHDGNFTGVSGAEFISPEFAKAAQRLRDHAAEFGNNCRMLQDGTIVSREAYDSMERTWSSMLPERRDSDK